MLHDLWRLPFAFIGHFSIAVSFFIVEPEIQSVTTDQSVLRGSSVKLRCSANGVPTPTVVWTKNGSDVVLIKAESTAILFFKNVTKQHHEGVYHCAINNTEGRDDTDVNIKVVGKFTIAPEKWLHCERVGIACVAKRNLTLVSDVCEAAARSSFPPADSTNYRKSVWGEGYVSGLNFKTRRFLFWGGSPACVCIQPLYLRLVSSLQCHMHSFNPSLCRLSPFQKMWLWWGENNRNVVVVVVVEGNNRNVENQKREETKWKSYLSW